MAKRDLERMRQILFWLEEREDDGTGWVWTRGEGFFQQSDNYQIVLLNQAGFVDEAKGRTIASVVPDRLMVTFQGHEYLDIIRDDGIWKKTKSAIAVTGGNASLEIVKALAMGFVKKKISQHTGVEI